MLQLIKLVNKTAVARYGGAMEEDTISKNGRNSKSQTSRGKSKIIFLSMAMLLSVAKGFAQYCIPVTNCSNDDRFTLVRLVKVSDPSVYLINNVDAPCENNGYSDFTNTEIQLIPGESYQITVSVAHSSHQVHGWIDWDDNTVFDLNESFIFIPCPSANQQYSRTFEIPFGAKTGTFRFRLSTRYNGVPDPCGNYIYGQTHDYTVISGYQISGNVTYNGNPLEGVALFQDPYSNTLGITNTLGDYNVAIAPNSVVTITPALAGYVFTPENITYTDVTNNITNQNFTATTINTHTISGQVTSNGSPLAGITITTSSGLPVVTNQQGEYEITVNNGANVTITPRLAGSGYIFTPGQITCTNVIGNLVNQNFTALELCSTPIASGATGSLQWVLCPDGTLTISGEGEMPDTEDPYLGYSWTPYRQNIFNVVIGNGVTSIGVGAFYEFANLASVTIPNSVTTIGNWAFSGCPLLTSIDMPNVETIGNYAFQVCFALDTIDMPNVVTIGQGAFWYCTSLTSIDMPNVVTIGQSAFGRCTSLTSITIPENVTSIGDGVFLECTNLETVNYNAIACDEYMNSVFIECPAFTTLNIGNEVTQIPGGAFADCNTLTSINVYAITPPVLGYDTFNGVPANIPVTIPCMTYINYSNAAGWSYFSNFIIDGPATPEITHYTALKCIGAPYTDNNFPTPIYVPGIYYKTWANIEACDSIVSLTLTEYPPEPATHYYATICQGTSYSDENFTNLTLGDTYILTLQNVFGCDSVVYLHLSVTPPPIHYYSAMICPGSSYTDANFPTPIFDVGEHLATLKTSEGCDSIVSLYLSFVFPSEQELCMVSVDDNYRNVVVWKVLDEISSYNVYREGSQSGQYDLAASIDYGGLNSWTDFESDARIRSYRYRVAAVDTCGNESALSSIHRTMHLTINSGVGDSWNLIWTAYEGTEYSTYNIYRSSGETMGELVLIGTMPSGNTSYSDFNAPSGYVYYMVEIVLNEPCAMSRSLTSIKSNIATNNPNVSIKYNNIENMGITIYPNPTKGVFTVVSNGTCPIISSIVVEIFDITGRLVGTYNIRPEPNGSSPEPNDTVHRVPCTVNREIDISHLPNGVYFVQIGREVMKVVKK